MGNIIVIFFIFFLVEVGDFIGVFYFRDVEEGVVVSVIDEISGIFIREFYINYYVIVYDEDFIVGLEFNLEKITFEEIKVIFVIKVIMDYIFIGRKIILSLFCRNII